LFIILVVLSTKNSHNFNTKYNQHKMHNLTFQSTLLQELHIIHLIKCIHILSVPLPMLLLLLSLWIHRIETCQSKYELLVT